jgi:chromosome segregation ATPase
MSYFNGNYLSQAPSQFASFDRCLSHRTQSINQSQHIGAQDDLEISKIQREVIDLSNQEYDCESVQKETKQLEAQVLLLTEKIVEQNAEAKTQREAVLMQIAKAQAGVKLQQKRLERVEAEYRKYVLENADAEMMMKNREFKAIHTNDVLRDATMAYQNVKSDFTRLRKEARNIAEDKIHITSQIEELEDCLEKKMTEFKILKEKITQLQIQYTSFEALKNRMETENTEVAKEERQQQAHADEIEHELFVLKIDLTNSINEVEQLKNEAFSLRTEILILEAKITKHHQCLKEKEAKIANLSEEVQTEREFIQQKAAFICDLNDKEQEKHVQIDQKRQDIADFKTKTEQLKQFSSKAFKELAKYVKLDRTISATFARGYQVNHTGGLGGSHIYSEVKLY